VPYRGSQEKFIPIDHFEAVFTNKNFEMKEFGMWIKLEKSMGYDAKGCISPKQVELVNEMFVDEEEQIKRAKVIVKLFEMYQDEGVTGFVDEEYGFIDEPIYKGALSLLDRVKND